MNIIIIQLFWYLGDNSRLNNIFFTTKQSLKLKKYLSNYFNVIYKLYDFSEKKFINEDYVIHIPKPELKYNKSWKINRVIEQSKDYDVFLYLDCDVFLMEEDFEKIKNYLIEIKENNSFYVSNLNDLYSLDGINFIDGTFDKTKFKYGSRYVNSLGPCYIAKIKDLIRCGGFNENFTVWGGEDDEFALILEKNNLNRITMDLRPLHLPHNTLDSRRAIFTKEYEEQCYHLNNTKTIERKNYIL